MITRIFAGFSVSGAILAVFLLGAGQFGYPYAGMLGGFGAFLKFAAIKSQWLMIAVPLVAIVIGMVYMFWSVFTMLVLTFRVFIPTPVYFLRWAEFWSPFILSTVMLSGLGLHRAFPGIQEVPVEFSNGHFVYPALLFIASLCLRFVDKKSPNKGRQATASPSPAT